MKTQDRTKQEIKIKQLITYSPIGKGGQKLASLDENGVVCIYDDAKQEWIATNTSLKQPEKQEIEIAGKIISEVTRLNKEWGAVPNDFRHWYQELQEVVNKLLKE